MKSAAIFFFLLGLFASYVTYGLLQQGGYVAGKTHVSQQGTFVSGDSQPSTYLRVKLLALGFTFGCFGAAFYLYRKSNKKR